MYRSILTIATCSLNIIVLCIFISKMPNSKEIDTIRKGTTLYHLNMKIEDLERKEKKLIVKLDRMYEILKKVKERRNANKETSNTDSVFSYRNEFKKKLSEKKRFN